MARLKCPCRTTCAGTATVIPRIASAITTVTMRSTRATLKRLISSRKRRTPVAPLTFTTPTRDAYCSRLQKAAVWMTFWWRAVLMGGLAFEVRTDRLAGLRFALFHLVLVLQIADNEVNWEYVRCLPDGETVSVDGTHLGHNLVRTTGCAHR